jgi:GNAT superfamily N-acetyltransferase
VSDLKIGAEAPGHPDALWCLDRYFGELEQRFEGGYRRDMDPVVADAQFLPPGGLFLVARIDGRPVGCGAIKCVDSQLGEIKRIWVAGDARGRGIARQILEALEIAARDMGYRAVRLDSNRVLTEAHALYRSAGYSDCTPFNDDSNCHIWMSKTL